MEINTPNYRASYMWETLIKNNCKYKAAVFCTLKENVIFSWNLEKRQYAPT